MGKTGCLGKEEDYKRMRTDPTQAGTSKDHYSASTVVSQSSSSTTGSETTEDESVMEGSDDLPIKNYRFKMINHMPMKDATVKEVCKEWGIKEVSYQWDIIDLENKKFVRVRYSYDTGRDTHNYLRAKSEVPKNCDMYLIEAGKTKGRWLERNKEAVGESKITKFLVERMIVLENLKINDNLYMPPVSLDTLFPSSWLKKEMGKWEEDLLKDEFETYSEAQLYRKEQPPSTIKPSDFLKNLKPVIESDNPQECIKWKGKMLPEPFCLNVQTKECLDRDIVTLLFTNIQEELDKGIEVIEINMKENSELSRDLLTEIIDIWRESDKNTFSFMERANQAKCAPIKEALGIGRKGIKNAPYSEDMQQPEYSELKCLKYSPWIEEVIIGMEESTRTPIGYTACPELINPSPTDGHPIPRICEPITTELLRTMLKTNAGIQISKIVNTYSRLGGAYNSGEVYGKEIFKNVAIFPIVATLSNAHVFEGNFESEEKLRLVSGVVIRAPYHARRPTDKIMMITIELAEKTEKTRCFLDYVNNCLVYETSKFYVVVRQNAVMKEDSTYNAFITTALFTPINMLGCLTLENPCIRREEDMKSLMENTLDRGEKWFIERAIEGVLFSMIGNSRDEGYFSYLRKMFLVLLTWRKGKAAASLDIETFCNKANECLVDNPISFYFHRTLLFVLEVYRNRGKRLSDIEED